MGHDELLLIADIIDRHISIRNKSRKEISSILKAYDITDKLDDHLKNPQRLTITELFTISDILDIGLDYIKNNIINFKNNKMNLYGNYKICRMNIYEHNKANKIIRDEIKRLYLYSVKDIIEELKKVYRKGYIIDALLPISNISNNNYEIYYKESKKRGERREGTFNIYPAYPYNIDVMPDCQFENQFLQLIIIDILKESRK